MSDRDRRLETEDARALHDLDLASVSEPIPAFLGHGAAHLAVVARSTAVHTQSITNPAGDISGVADVEFLSQIVTSARDRAKTAETSVQAVIDDGTILLQRESVQLRDTATTTNQHKKRPTIKQKHTCKCHRSTSRDLESITTQINER
jgi:hypothetical protein